MILCHRYFMFSTRHQHWDFAGVSIIEKLLRLFVLLAKKIKIKFYVAKTVVFRFLPLLVDLEETLVNICHFNFKEHVLQISALIRLLIRIIIDFDDFQPCGRGGSNGHRVNMWKIIYKVKKNYNKKYFLKTVNRGRSLYLETPCSSG